MPTIMFYGLLLIGVCSLGIVLLLADQTIKARRERERMTQRKIVWVVGYAPERRAK